MVCLLSRMKLLQTGHCSGFHRVIQVYILHSFLDTVIYSFRCEDWSSERVLCGEKTYLSPAHVFFHGDDWNSMHLNFTSNGRDPRQWKTWPTSCLRNSNVMSAKIASFDMVNVAPYTALQRKPCISRLEFYIQHIGAKTSRFVLQRVVGVCVCARYQPHSCFCMTASWVGSPWTKGMGWFLCMDLPSCLEDLQ